MFTGIVTDIGTVKTIETKKGGRVLTVATRFNMAKVAKGASIACAGVCLTVIAKGKGWFRAEVSPETLKCTHIDTWRAGRKLNLEQALKVGDELGGHIVSGHVDGLAKIKKVAAQGENHKLVLTAPKKLSAFIATKGSVALDGISLTVNKAKGNQFTVNIIPHTWDNTTLKDVKAGAVLHLEIDTLARYAARLLEKKKHKK